MTLIFARILNDFHEILINIKSSYYFHTVFFIFRKDLISVEKTKKIDIRGISIFGQALIFGWYPVSVFGLDSLFSTQVASIFDTMRVWILLVPAVYASGQSFDFGSRLQGMQSAQRSWKRQNHDSVINSQTNEMAQMLGSSMHSMYTRLFIRARAILVRQAKLGRARSRLYRRRCLQLNTSMRFAGFQISRNFSLKSNSNRIVFL